MSKTDEQRAFVAEVIDMDDTESFSSRPSNRFTKRTKIETGIPIDDPAARFLFDGTIAADRKRRRTHYSRNLRNFTLAFVMGMAGAWVVWVTPGLGPMEQQVQLQGALLKNQTEILDLHKQLVQAQARTIELTKTTEIQRTLLEEGESARRAMLEQVRKSENKLEQSLAELTKNQQRIEELASIQTNNATFARKQAESVDVLKKSVDYLKDDLVRLDEDVKQADVSNQQQLANLKSDHLIRQKEELQRFSKLIETELASLKQGDLTDMKSRMERLAEHVWQEVGRLDGRIVRASATVEQAEMK